MKHPIFIKSIIVFMLSVIFFSFQNTAVAAAYSGSLQDTRVYNIQPSVPGCRIDNINTYKIRSPNDLDCLWYYYGKTKNFAYPKKILDFINSDPNFTTAGYEFDNRDVICRILKSKCPPVMFKSLGEGLKKMYPNPHMSADDYLALAAMYGAAEWSMNSMMQQDSKLRDQVVALMKKNPMKYDYGMKNQCFINDSMGIKEKNSRATEFCRAFNKLAKEAVDQYRAKHK